MIRDYEPTDMNDVLDIWLKASIKAHSFIESEFWKSKLDDMRKTYIPAFDTYVFLDNGTINGFISIKERIDQHTGHIEILMEYVL